DAFSSNSKKKGGMNQWVIYDGELFTCSVFKDKTFRKLFENPIEGDIGYAVRRHTELELAFNAEYRVWHRPGINPAHYRDRLMTRDYELIPHGKF
ncbi:MAG TPA: hypothetical protein VFT82_01225, partial [Candidatus Paceibacterota bacterium]|nr:hypothetical protein [Candidatus Paceibacterota bacterium]